MRECLTTSQRVAAAVALLDAGPARKAHPRAAAFLLRRALEAEFDAYIAQHCPALRNCRMGTKAAWLAQRLTPALAGRLGVTWNSLSAACHHHQFLLPPTAGEVLAWRTDVAYVLRELAALSVT